MKIFSFSIRQFIGLGILFVLIVGSLFHFIYDWSNHLFWVGLIAPISESVWEHFKLGFYALVLYSLISYPFIRIKVNNYLFAVGMSSIALNLLIGLGYMGYTHLLQDHFFLLDLLLYFLGVIFSFFIFYKIIVLPKLPSYFSWIGGIILFSTIVLFVLFTLNPPTQFELFKDPTKQSYNVLTHSFLSTSINAKLLSKYSL